MYCAGSVNAEFVSDKGIDVFFVSSQQSSDSEESKIGTNDCGFIFLASR